MSTLRYDGAAHQWQATPVARPVVVSTEVRHLNGEATSSGGVAEWTKALVLKTSEVNASQGSTRAAQGGERTRRRRSRRAAPQGVSRRRRRIIPAPPPDQAGPVEIAAMSTHRYDGAARQWQATSVARPVVASTEVRHLNGEAASSGGVAEWTKALVLKTSEVNASQGSNPCPSATQIRSVPGTWFTVHSGHIVNTLSPKGLGPGSMRPSS